MKRFRFAKRTCILDIDQYFLMVDGEFYMLGKSGSWWGCSLRGDNLRAIVSPEHAVTPLQILIEVGVDPFTWPLTEEDRGGKKWEKKD